MHSNVKINRSRISTSLDSATPFTAVVFRTDLLKKVSDHPQGKWCQNTDSEQSTRWQQNRNQIRASNGDSRLQIHSTHTCTRKSIHQYLCQKTTHLSQTNTYYLKSAFHSDQDTGITLTLIASQEKIAGFLPSVSLLFNCRRCHLGLQCGPEMSCVNQRFRHTPTPFPA